MIPRDATGRLLTPTSAITDAHGAGLIVIGWTFRRENSSCPLQFRSSTDPAAPGDLRGEIADLPRRRHGRLLHRQPRHRRPGRRQAQAARDAKARTSSVTAIGSMGEASLISDEVLRRPPVTFGEAAFARRSGPELAAMRQDGESAQR